MNNNKLSVALGLWLLGLGVLQQWVEIPFLHLLTLAIVGGWVVITGWAIYRSIGAR